MEAKVEFSNAEGETLVGTLHTPAAPDGRAVVLGHCFTCSRHTAILRQIGDDLSAAGIYALRFDFSGNGQSGGDFARSTISKQVAEMKTACAFVAARGGTRLGLAGHSMGALIAFLSAVEMPDVRAVCCLAGRLSGVDAGRFLSAPQQAELQRSGRVVFVSRGRDLEMTRAFVADAAAYDLPRLVAATRKPLLIVHGEKDEIIAVQEAYAAHALNPDFSELTVVPQADHMFSQASDRQRIAADVTSWFQKRLD